MPVDALAEGYFITNSWKSWGECVEVVYLNLKLELRVPWNLLEIVGSWSRHIFVSSSKNTKEWKKTYSIQVNIKDKIDENNTSPSHQNTR